MQHSTLRKIVAGSSLLILLGAGCIEFQGTGGGGTDGGIWKSDDKGKSWRQKTAISSVGQARSMGPTNVTDLAFDTSVPGALAMYAGTEANGLFYSYDGGESWHQAVSLGNVRVNAVAVNPASKCTIFVATGNRVVRSSDCSRTWENAYFESRPQVGLVDVIIDHYNPANIFAATSAGDLLRSSDAGGSWTTIRRFESDIRQLLMTKDSRVMYVVTKSRGVWKTTDSGANWNDLTSKFGKFAGALDNTLLVEDLTKDGSLLASSNHGLLKTTDGGENWAAIPLVTPPGSTVIHSLAVSHRDSNAIYYGTVNTLFRTVDGGAKWVSAALPTSRAATVLRVDPTNDNNLFMGTFLFQK
jgi:photosystem II stability/assembly factor-like uncharacterized protein